MSLDLAPLKANSSSPPASTTSPLTPRQVVFDRLAIALFVVLAILIFSTFRDYGITWDEPENDHYGYLIVKYYLALLHGKYDSGAVTVHGISIYGGLFNTLQTLAIAVLPFGAYESRHLINALAGLLGIIGCWKLGRLLGGPAGGFWAALLMAATPRFYGAMFNNPKDIPSAVAYVWSIYYLAMAYRFLPRLPWALVLKLGLSIGCALAIRTGAFLLLFYMGLIWIAFLLRQLFNKEPRAAITSSAFAMTKSFAAIAGIAWALMLLFWPWAQQQPIFRPFESAKTFLHYPWDHLVLYNGVLLRSLDVPRTYMTRWLFMTSPELTLVLLAAGLVIAVVMLWRNRLQLGAATIISFGIVVLSVLFPIAIALATRPVFYDAERHFTYVIPPAVCLAAAVLAGAELLNRKVRIAIYTVAGACIIYQGSLMFRLHPNEYVYFNQISGGLSAAYRKYDTDYWGNSYREAVKSLAGYLTAVEEPAQSKHYTVMTFSERLQSTYYFPKWMTYVKQPDQADFIVSITRDGMDESVDGTPILTVSRLGVPLAIVKDRRSLKGIAPRGWYSHP